MELLKLDLNFDALGIVEEYSSLIWSERYRAFGEFELKTTEVEAGMADMPLRSYLSLTDSREVMIVENHAIEEDPDGVATLTVSGRSWETFFESRPALKNYDPIDADQNWTNPPPKYDWQLSARTAAACARDVVNWCTFNTTEATTLDHIAHPVTQAQISNITTKSQPARVRKIARTTLYEFYMNILGEENLGTRNVRPLPTQTKMTIEIYNGTDRSGTVILDVSAGHFGKTSYLFSSKERVDRCFAFFPDTWDLEYQDDFDTSGYLPSGYSLREGFIDFPGENISAMSPISGARARAELAKRNNISLFEGEVSPDIPYKYGTDYKLGDTVRVLGKYGINRKAMVSEYVRTQDAEGERGFPTLS